MILLPYFIAFLIGKAALDLLTRKSAPVPGLISVLLALGLGMGISSLLTFASFLCFFKYTPWAIIGLNLSFLAALLFLNAEFFIRKWRINPRFAFNWPDAAAAVVLAVLGSAMFYLARTQHPYGEWDAWGMWNLKTKFLILSGGRWTEIFSELDFHTHPDYPLLLPFYNVWNFSFAGGEITDSTFMTSFILAFGCALLLYAALRSTAGKALAFLATWLMTACPYYMFLGTFQYADIMVAFYLLCAFVAFNLASQTKSNSWLGVCGLFLGLMTFVKNEGIVMAGIFLALVFLLPYLSASDKTKHSGTAFRPLVLGFCITAAATVVFKLLLAPANHDILPAVNILQIDSQRLMRILSACGNEMIDKRWCHIWLFIVFLAAVKFFRFFKEENKTLSIFLILHIISVILIYLTAVDIDIDWWLKSSLRRLYFQLLPATLYLCFYVHATEYERNKNT